MWLLPGSLYRPYLCLTVGPTTGRAHPPCTQVPEHLWQATPVRLLATAGLRLVTDEQRDSILDACRSLLASSRFAFRHDWAKVIGGDMEGVYAWTGANYAAGALQVREGEGGSGGGCLVSALQAWG